MQLEPYLPTTNKGSTQTLTHESLLKMTKKTTNEINLNRLTSNNLRKNMPNNIG